MKVPQTFEMACAHTRGELRKLREAGRLALEQAPLHWHKCKIEVGDKDDACTCWVNKMRKALAKKPGAPPRT